MLTRATVALGALLLAGCATAVAPTTTTITPITTTEVTAAGQPIMLPEGAVAVSVNLYEIPAGTRLAVHRHAYPRYAYVLSGTLRVTAVGTGAFTDYGPGDFIVEMVGPWHFGEAIGNAPARLVVIDQAPPGVNNTELMDEAP